MRKIFASYTSDRGLITRIYRELGNLNSQRINNPVKEWADKLKRHFLKDKVQVANKYMKKCSTSLTIMEIQIKTTLRFHLNIARMAYQEQK
jgi:1,2-phenylacetyl-CoA epoxidase catalytic subunit